jgi:hypothetical protein
VAMLVVLIPASEAEPSLQPTALSKLAQLGVTSLAISRDNLTLALVVEGWAFDPSRSAEAVVGAVAAQGSGARALYPVMQMAVSAAASGLRG